MRVWMTVTREYEMDAEKILAEFGPPDKFGQTAEQFLHESFYELAGFERDEDHIDGTYVRLTGEHGELGLEE